MMSMIQECGPTNPNQIVISAPPPPSSTSLCADAATPTGHTQLVSVTDSSPPSSLVTDQQSTHRRLIVLARRVPAVSTRWSPSRHCSLPLRRRKSPSTLLSGLLVTSTCSVFFFIFSSSISLSLTASVLDLLETLILSSTFQRACKTLGWRASFFFPFSLWITTAASISTVTLPHPTVQAISSPFATLAPSKD
ncbi:hypothetical protein PIB30_000375 [Stylosanthes scabra]|uniref:Uncharacterized protein n=1 Tax=Stylosanthes scabra TaxID=79078 RepID=A0ABU6U4Z9_9FABA|nr:hypothetical protein [Stylosanthes scabra]